MTQLNFIRQAFGSPGGKSRVAEKLIKLMPEHKIFCEVFAGGAAVFFKKKLSEVEILNDKDSDIAFVYRFMKNLTEDQISELKKLKWDSDKNYFDHLKKTKTSNDTERFHRFVYLNRFSYGKMMKNYFNPEIPQHSGIVSRLPDLHERLKGVRIHCEDYLNMIKKYDSPDTFFFIDPPYPEEWPGEGAFTFDDLKKMEQSLKHIKGKFLLTLNILPQIKDMFSSFKIRKLKFPRTLQRQEKWGHREYELLIANYDIMNIKFSELDFIRNVADYDPKEIANEQLADDWRIVTGWFSIFVETEGKGIKYSREDIVNLAKIIYDEIVSRVKAGEMVHDFQPEEMKPTPKELYKIVSKGQEIPFAAQMNHVYLVAHHANMAWKDEKSLIIRAKNIPDMTRIPLILVDKNYAYGVIKFRPADEINKQQFDELKLRHKITDEESKKWWGDIDVLYSYEFEWIEKYKKPQPIKVSQGTQTFFDFSQTDMNKNLSHFKDMTIINRFISVAGGFVDKNGEGHHDIDCIIRMSPPNDFIRRAIESRFDKEIPKEIADNIHAVFDAEGPHSKFIPLYDLVLRRIPKSELIQMAQEATLMQAYMPQKPHGSAYYKIEDIMNQIKEDVEYSVEFKYNGFHVSVHKKNTDVKIFSEQKKNLTVAFPTLTEEIKKLSPKDFIVDGELVPYDKEGNMLGRNVLMKYVGAVESGKEIDDSNIKIHIWDILHFGD